MATHLSQRTAWDLSEGDLARAVRERRATGAELLDLTVSNPTVCGFRYDAAAILEPLQAQEALVYDPEPRGLLSARQAVAGYYAARGAAVDPSAILLTTSTSEAYSFLFRLLADVGDVVLAAQPSYPLFDFLARLENVTLEPYVLFYDFGWWIDFAELERRIGPRTRAVVVVHPNNPTGHWTSESERLRLEELCARRGLALIVDEVFLDYPVGGQPAGSSFATGPHACLTFVVSGLSKIAALPQMKAGWIAVFGPEPERREALARLEIVADTFLSMNAPVQLALPHWLAGRETVAGQVRSRVAENLAQLEAAGLEYLPVAAGWSVVVRLPMHRREAHGEEIAIRLVNEAGVVTHPGTFYGLSDRYLVLSLIGPVQVFARAVAKLKMWFQTNGLTGLIPGSTA